MKSLYSPHIFSRAVLFLSLFLFLAALVFADMAKNFSVFKPYGSFCVVLDPGHGGYQMRKGIHKGQTGNV